MNSTCEFYLKYVKYPQYDTLLQTDCLFHIAQLLRNTVSLLFLESRITCRLYIFERKKKSKHFLLDAFPLSITVKHLLCLSV